MLDWSPIDLAVRDAVRQFIDKEVRPHVDALESGEMEPYPIIRKMFATFGIDALAKEGLQKQIEKKKAREAALAAGERPAESKKSDGGGAMGLAGGSAGMGFVLTSEISRVCMGLVTGMGVSMGLTVPTIAARGTAAQMERWLPELVTYEKVGAWAITEPDSGSDAFGGMKTYVTRDGEDYILNGQKTFITNGPDADVIVVYAKLNEGAGKDSVDPRDRKVLTFVLDKGMEGFTQSKPFRKMGIHSSRTGQLFFENVRLGKDRLLGETETNDQGDGRDSARANFSMERIGVAALALGVIEEVCACRWTMPSRAPCGARRSLSSSSSSSNWPRWRWPGSTCATCCSMPSRACRRTRRLLWPRHRRSSSTVRRRPPTSRWTPCNSSAAMAT
ncbi:Probable acyl-CoA dehydrogenase FadE [Mycobacteroides abscessus]|nr:Probable acyl-CoA dehydrogenase FadE [Mycobacteroides abscessus]